MPWLEGVGIPYIALIALAVIEGQGGWDTLARKVLELGIDLCILGIGVCGALFANHSNGAPPSVTAVAVAVLFVTLIIVGLCLHLRTWEGATERTRASISLFLGMVALGINTAIVFAYNKWRLTEHAMTMTELMMLLVPAVISGVSAVMIFQVADRVRENRAAKLRHRHRHPAAA